MIEVSVSHSYEDDYNYIDSVTVDLKDKQEESRIKEILSKDNTIVGELMQNSQDMKRYIAHTLGVEESLIQFEVNEIDSF